MTADDLLSAKLQLETEIAGRVWRWCVPYVRDRVGSGSIPHERARRWLRELEHILGAHYARVVMVVTGRDWQPGATIAAAALSVRHLDSLTRRVTHQADLIITSVGRLIESESLEVKAEPGPSHEPKPGWWGKAKAVLDKIKRALGKIANVQTNGPAEEARIEEASRRSGNRVMFKRWSTMRDIRVRDWHVAAEGQEQTLTRPYEVGGERLWFPGDTSLGASLRNIINCRCSSQIYARNPDGSLELLSETIRLTPVRPNLRVRRATRPDQVTTAVTLRGTMRTEVFLPDMLSAWVSIRGGVIRVTRGNQRLAIGRYTHGYWHGSRVDGLVISPGADGLGIRELIERSLAATNGR